jgi:uncharacterized membrane protein
VFDIPLHRLITHFPIALGIFALVYDSWGVYARRPALHETGYGMSLWAALSGLISVVTGLQIAGLGQIGQGAVTGHALFGILTSVVLAAFGIWRYSARARQETTVENFPPIWLVIQALAALLVIAAAITGHRLI